jgi:hypothetical protein
MAGYLLSELGVYMMTREMTGKEAMSLVMCVTASPQVEVMNKTNGGWLRR